MSEWFNIKELAKKTGIPETSVRRYVSAFSGFFPYVGGKRSRRYESTSVEVLLRIKALYDGGYESIGVEEQLRKDFPVVIDGEQSEKSSETANPPALLTAEDIWEIKRDLKEYKDVKTELEHTRQELKDTKEELKALTEVLQLLPQNLLDLEKSIKESIENRDQPRLEKVEETEEKESIEEAAEPPKEKKPGLFKRFFG